IYFCPMIQAKDDLQTRWWKLEEKFMKRFNKKPDVETILFLIGIQEIGNFKKKFSKEQKQDLMHVAVCSLLAQSGFYKLEGTDEEGWPHYAQLKALPAYNMIEQESFLKDHILIYFENIGEPFKDF
ncbi:MAG: hypothetical protein ABIN25_02085, partial [Ginsengibacter sp.]